MAKAADGKAIRAQRAALVAVLASGAGALWTAPAGTADLNGVSDAPASTGPVASFGQAPGGFGHPGVSGRSASGGRDPSGSALVQSAADSRSPTLD